MNLIARSVEDGVGMNVRPQLPTQSESPRSLWPLTLPLLVTFFINAPVLVWGLQFGHDHNLHLTYLHFFESQLRAGELYPRWITGLNFGAGSPIFFVQYPLPYYATAAIHWLLHLPDTAEALAKSFGVFIFLTGVVASFSSWLWYRKLSNPWVASFAAAAFVSMPYLWGCDVYFRGAVGEYSALAFLPSILYFVHELRVHGRRGLAGIALAFAIVILSNLFTAILFAPFLLLYSLVFALEDGRAFKAITQVSIGMLLGSALSAGYLLPMNQHRIFFSGEALNRVRGGIFDYHSYLFPLGGHVFPESGTVLKAIDTLILILGIAIALAFLKGILSTRVPRTLAFCAAIILISTCASPLSAHFDLLVLSDATSVRVLDVRSRIFLISFLTLEVALLAYLMLKKRGIIAQVLISIVLASYILETRWSGWLWQKLPLLWNIQFPWRLTGILSVFAGALFAVALYGHWEPYRSRVKAISIGSIIWVVVTMGTYFALDVPQIIRRPFFTEVRAKLDSSFPAYAKISELPGSRELGADDGLSSGALVQTGQGTAQLEVLDPRHQRLNVECQTPCNVQLRLLYYPLWRANEGIDRISIQPSGAAGLSSMVLSAGKHSISLNLPVSPAETWGARISLVSLAAVSLMLLSGWARNARFHSIPAKLA